MPAQVTLWVLSTCDRHWPSLVLPHLYPINISTPTFTIDFTKLVLRSISIMTLIQTLACADKPRDFSN